MLDPIPNLDCGSQELDLAFVGNRKLALILANDVYHTLIDKYKWMEE